MKENFETNETNMHSIVGHDDFFCLMCPRIEESV